MSEYQDELPLEEVQDDDRDVMPDVEDVDLDDLYEDDPEAAEDAPNPEEAKG